MKKLKLIAEVLPPKINANPALAAKQYEKAHDLIENGAHLLSLPFNPRNSNRLRPDFFAQQLNLPSIIHITLYDKTPSQLQDYLIQLDKKGLHDIFIVEGERPTSMDSVQAIDLIANYLNRGKPFSKSQQQLQQATQFRIGCGVNLTPPNKFSYFEPMYQQKRLAAKIDAGATFVMTQAVFDAYQSQSFLQTMSTPLQVPLYLGVVPLCSTEHAKKVAAEHQPVGVMPFISDEHSIEQCERVVQIMKPFIDGIHILYGKHLTMKLLEKLKTVKM